MAGEPEKKATEMAKDQREDSGDWLADIFDAADEGAITSLEMTEMSLPQETIAALEAEGSGAAGTPGSGDKRGREEGCLLYTSPSPRDGLLSRMPSSA